MPTKAKETAKPKILTVCASGLAAEGSSTRLSSRMTSAKSASASTTMSGSDHQRKAAS
jgi:hypothetical protein